MLFVKLTAGPPHLRFSTPVELRVHWYDGYRNSTVISSLSIVQRVLGALGNIKLNNDRIGYVRFRTHGLRGVVPRPKEVDHVTLRSRAGRFLQDHDVPAVRVESLCQREPGNASSADNDLHARGLSLLD